MRNALHLWSELEQAYYSDNSFGSTVAEIYAYRFNEHSEYGKINEEIGREDGLRTAQSLFMLLTEFSDFKSCKLKVDGEDFGPWIKDMIFNHRVHVEVIRNK